MAFPFYEALSLSPSSSCSTISTTIMDSVKKKPKQERPLEFTTPSKSKSPSKFKLPMPSTISRFVLPHLSPTKPHPSNRSFSLNANIKPPSFPLPSTRPSLAKSLPRLKNRRTCSSNMESPFAPSFISDSPIQEYCTSHPQPDPETLPPAKKERPRARYLRTEKEKKGAREARKELLGVVDRASPVVTVRRVDENEEVDEILLPPATFDHPPSPISPSSDPFPHIILFSIRTQTFRHAPRSDIFTSIDPHIHTNPIMELPSDIRVPVFLPPLLVDGRMTMDEIPRWSRKMRIHWRSHDGQAARLYHKVVDIPQWLWRERNLGVGGKMGSMSVFIERG